DEDSPGLHISRRVRKAILQRFYVDVFTLLKPEEEGGGMKERHKTKKPKCQATERNFENWLEGFAEYAGIIQAAYPERAWHLNNHYKNVLCRVAGEAATLAYDENFRKEHLKAPKP
ncbi:hypothetical protein JRQ81_007438, partial [Phrynocephalus forsythii]